MTHPFFTKQNIKRKKPQTIHSIHNTSSKFNLQEFENKNKNKKCNTP